MEQQMLSERQWAWLEGVLDEEADLRVIVSSIQVLSDGCVFEAWRHLPKERGRLYDMIRDKNAILVSGDRHVGAFLESDDGSLREVTASSWTHTIPFGAYGSNCSSSEECDEVDSRRVGHFVRVNHFGSLEIDWEKREYMVALRKAETSYGTMYHHNWDSDAGMVIRSVNYTF
jgi:alkaline phosphatase D